MSEKTYSYFGLKRGVIYKCNRDGADFSGKFEYKLHRHWLVYRKLYPDMKPGKWAGVWNNDWYGEMTASYRPIKGNAGHYSTRAISQESK